MVSWSEFAAAAPEMAQRGAERFGVGVAYLATTAKDGAPRVHPVTPLIADGRLCAFIAVATPKYHNLRRDGRCALHAVLGQDDEEFVVTGRAVVANDWASRLRAAAEARKIGMTSKDDVLHEFRIERAHWAIWEGLGTPEIRVVRKHWP